MTEKTLRRTITGLASGSDFLLRMRAYSRLNVPSEWSEVLMIRTGGDLTVPKAPTSLDISFTSADLILNWIAPTHNTDDSTLEDLSRYRITLTSGGNVTRQFESYSPFFYLPIAQNRATFPPGASSFTISIEALDIYDKASPALTGTATQPALSKPYTPTLSLAGTLMSVLMTPQTADVGKVDKYHVEHSTDGTTWDEVGTSTIDIFSYPVARGETHHFRYWIEDVFGRLSPTSDSASLLVRETDSDGVPPSHSPTPVVTGAINMLAIKWEKVPNPDLITYEVHISSVSGFTPTSATLVGETKSTFSFIKNLPNNTPLAYGTTYYVRIVAKDDDGIGVIPGGEGSGETYSVTSEDIADKAVDLLQLADKAIRDPRVLQAGVITGELIKANTISTINMVIGSFDNFIKDPSFDLADFDAGPHVVNSAANGTWDYFATASARSPSKVLRYSPGAGQDAIASLNFNGANNVTDMPAAKPGDKHYIGIWGRAANAGAANNFRVSVQYCNSAGTALATFTSSEVTATTTYQRASTPTEGASVPTAPAGTAYVRFTLNVMNNGNNNPIYFDDTYGRVLIDAQLLVDGTITGRKVLAGSIRATDAIFETAAIKALDVETISASQLTAGVIDADTISVINLNADNINSGTITGRSISGGTITGATITGGTIQTDTAGKRMVIDGTNDKIWFHTGNVKEKSPGYIDMDIESAAGTTIGRLFLSSPKLGDGASAESAARIWLMSEASSGATYSPQVTIRTDPEVQNYGLFSCDMKAQFNGDVTVLGIRDFKHGSDTVLTSGNWSSYISTGSAHTHSGLTDHTHSSSYSFYSYTVHAYGQLRLSTNGIDVAWESWAGPTYNEMFAKTQSGIGSGTPVGVAAINFRTTTSLRETKRDVRELNTSAISKIKKAKVYKFKWNHDEAYTNEAQDTLGFVIDDPGFPEEVRDGDGWSHDNAISMLWKGTQEQEDEIEALTARVAQLEQLIAQLTPKK